MAENADSGELFLVLDGRLDIKMSGPDGERHLASQGPGSYFGEVSLLDPGPAGASVVTEQGATTLRLGRARFDDLQAADPAAAEALLEPGDRVAGSACTAGRAGGRARPRTRTAVRRTTRARVSRRRSRPRRRGGAHRERRRRRRGHHGGLRRGSHRCRPARARLRDLGQAGPAPRRGSRWWRSAQTPGFKIGESTLGPVIRAWMSLGVPLPVQRQAVQQQARPALLVDGRGDGRRSRARGPGRGGDIPGRAARARAADDQRGAPAPGSTSTRARRS